MVCAAGLLGRPARAERSEARCCAVLELRQYTLHPGKRDALIALFEREFIEPQEAVGMPLVGQFRDRDNPDRFVWLRGFADMPSRAQALGAFYGGPVWKAHREEANATMVDSSNVLLLKRARPGSGFPAVQRPQPGAGVDSSAVVIATLYKFRSPVPESFLRFFEESIQPEVEKADAPVVASFETEESKNTYPALPVRENEHVFVWFSRFASAEAPPAVCGTPGSQPRVADEGRFGARAGARISARGPQAFAHQPFGVSLSGARHGSVIAIPSVQRSER